MQVPPSTWSARPLCLWLNVIPLPLNSYYSCSLILLFCYTVSSLRSPSCPVLLGHPSLPAEPHQQQLTGQAEIGKEKVLSKKGAGGGEAGSPSSKALWSLWNEVRVVFQETVGSDVNIFLKQVILMQNYMHSSLEISDLAKQTFCPQGNNQRELGELLSLRRVLCGPECHGVEVSPPHSHHC